MRKAEIMIKVVLAKNASIIKDVLTLLFSPTHKSQKDHRAQKYTRKES